MKMDCFKNRMLYVSPMITKKKIPIEDTEKKKESKHIGGKIQLNKKKDIKKGEEIFSKSCKKGRKQHNGNGKPFQSIITSNINII